MCCWAVAGEVAMKLRKTEVLFAQKHIRQIKR